MKYKVWLSILLVISFLAGCSLPLGNKNPDFKGHDKMETLGLTPDFSYVVTEQLPGILVNQAGYLPKSNKVAILQGNDLENVFYVYNSLTKEVEFTGILKPDSLFEAEESFGEEKDEENEKKENYLADFSGIETPGTYYIYHPDLGYSYEFEIEEDIYSEIENYLLTTLEKEVDDTSLICYQLSCLLITKELYPDNLPDKNRFDILCREKIEYLLRAQDEKTGSVYADVKMADKLKNLDEAQKQQHISLAATAEFAGVLAQYAFQIKNSDPEFADQCRNMAEKAYESIQKSLDNVGYDAGYFAVAHLYRLTTNGKYSGAMMQYMAMKEEQKRYTEYDFSLFADYAYITLGQGITLELGESLMKKIMSQAEEVSLTSGRNSYYVSEKRAYDDINGKLKDMSNLALVNYIITNHEYSTLLKNYVDFFMGRNPDNFCYMDGFGTRNPKFDHVKINEINGGLFYLLLQAAKI